MIAPRRRVRLAPVLMTALFALASLKAAGVFLHFSQAGAEETAPPVVLTPKSESETSARLSEQIAARQDELEMREAELDTREAVLAAAELRLAAAMEAVKKEKAALALADGGRREREDEIGALSNAYERMKPRDAARIFEVLDDDILIPVAAGMRTQALAGVLAEMAPEEATALTIALANRETLAAPPPEGAQ